MRILGIETSCDDTSACLLDWQEGDSHIEAFLNFDQTQLLQDFGGVVPELAAREHISQLPGLLKTLFEQAGQRLEDVDGIAVTVRPGLLGPLLTGLSVAKAMALWARLPLIPVNHILAHLEAVGLHQPLAPPYLGLVVSGGHSAYLLTREDGEHELLGTTTDDAAGEALDKGGKLLGLAYPAGQKIDELAKQGRAERFRFPIGLEKSQDARLSFSGVKTALRYLLQKHPEWDFKKGENAALLADLCASYQKAVMESLELKLRFALKEARRRTQRQDLPVVVGGGVAANSLLRQLLRPYGAAFVRPQFCTDNGAMIAYSGALHFDQRLTFPACLKLEPQGRFISKTGHFVSP